MGITAHIYSGDDDYICNLCNYNCCLEHNLVWDEKTWEPSDHKLVCQVCGEADNWESHVDGEDEDTLCDVCGFHMTDCTHSDTEGRHDEIDHWRYCHDCGQIIYSKEPHGFTLLYYAERKADGIHLTGSPWDLTVIFAAYTDAGKMIDIQVVENSSDVVTPNVTGEKVTAFFLNSRGMPVHASLSIP